MSRTRATRPYTRFAVSGVLIGLIVAAAPLVLFAQQPSQVERGGALFRARCAKCHGAEGQGGDGPRLIGAPNGLAGYETTPKLYEFVRTNMPVDDPGTLKDDEYWDVLAFLLDANRLLPPDVVLGPDTAEGVRLSP